jgi:endonuclease III
MPTLMAPRLQFKLPKQPLRENRNLNTNHLPKTAAKTIPKKKIATKKTAKKKKVASSPIPAKATPPNVSSHPRLPVDGEFETWRQFGESGGYKISRPQWDRLCSWVRELRRSPDVIADRVAFHQLIVSMKQSTNLATARDKWGEVLPAPNSPNFFWATLMLMLCTPLVPDTKIIEVFGPLFKEHHVDEKWVVELGTKKLAEILEPLGMFNKSAANITLAAHHMLELSREPRDYRDLLELEGVGPKIALVTIQEAHGKAQGVPCDVHMCRIFTLLNWIPSFVEEESSSCLDMLEAKKTGGEKYNYELARAAMEGWFPSSVWAELNQTWAGLGQLLNDAESRVVMCDFVDKATSNFDSPWRLGDKASFRSILSEYLTLKKVS